MTIEAMQQALEALEESLYATTAKSQFLAFEAIAALRTTIEQADDLEAWKTSDTAYRPDGLPQDFIKHEVDSFDDWSEWVCPDPEQYFMKCCDCGLVHKMQFKVVKYSEGDECKTVNDPSVQAVFRARRTTPPAAQPCPTCEALARTVMMDQTAHDTQRQPLTDEEIEALWNAVPNQALYMASKVFARAIEAAHGITGDKT
jgi:hypothetical protein